MKSIKNVSIIGLGSIGGAYASKIYDIDPECISVIAGGERAKRYKKNGFLINGKRYDFKYVSPDEKSNPADLVIAAVKNYQLSQAINDMKNQVGKDTIILSLLNGITSEEELGKAFGMDKVLYGLCIGIASNRKNNSIHFSSYGNITFGEKSNKTYSPKVQSVKELFDKAHIDYTIPEDMIRSLWYKFMINTGVNQCSAAVRGHYKVFQTNPQAQKLMESTMWEVINLAQKMKINLSGDDIQNWYKVLNKLNPESSTSMLNDIECGRKTEVDTFSGTVCKLGEKYGVPTPVNRTLFNIIKVIEQNK